MRLLLVCVFLLGISFIPVQNQFTAEAGRTVGGWGGGSYCECGCPAPPACYIEGAWDLCSTPPGSDPGPNCGGSQLNASPSSGESQNSIDLGSVGLLLLFGGFLFRRLI